MLYRWNKKELLANQQFYINKLKKDKNNEFYIDMINIYEDMINIKNNNNLLIDKNTNDNINDLIDDINDNYNDNMIPYINILLNSYKHISNYINIPKDYNININNNDYVNICSDFFKRMTPKDINKKYQLIMNSNTNFLNINYYNKDYFKGADFQGSTIIDELLKKKYISIFRRKELYDLVLLPHELFHYIFNDYDTTTIVDYNTILLTEIEGSFANILFSEYFYHRRLLNSKYDKEYFKNVFINQYSNNIINLVIRDNLIKSNNENKTFSLKRLNNVLDQKKIDIFKNIYELKHFIEIPEDIYITYSLSYLAALDLFYIYKKDQDKAFYLLQRIRNTIKENDLFKLFRDNNIKFMDNDYKNLKDYIKIKKI